MRWHVAVVGVAATSWIFSPSCAMPQSRQQIPDFIVTAAAVYKPLAELRGQERFPEGAKLLLVHDGKRETLVPGFADSADANVSFDGSTVLFAGKQSAGDPWQIWELNLKDRTVRRVTNTTNDAERPFYLPGGRLVWAQRTAVGFQLQSSGDGRPAPKFLNPTAGEGIVPLTYTRASAFPADVLRDGRILFEAGFPLNEGSTAEMYLVYADGSGVESVRCDHGCARWGGTQLSSGDIVFTHGTSLARFTSSMAHEVTVNAPRGEYAGAIAETAGGAWLMSVRTPTATRFAVKMWMPGAATMQTVLAIDGEDLVEPVVVAPRSRPNRHPSGLHPWNYANLLTLDARVSRDGDLRRAPAAVRVEAQNAAGQAVPLGTAPVEKDGSFFVRVPGDKPIRFELLDFRGAVLRQEHGWFWARGGEQRICVGCHAGPERASENRVPDVLMRTTAPLDMTGAKIAAGASHGN
ncbi:MAG TPA: hypothetical protein VMT38_06500 [Terracidiphilus sp.]|nr:hypothetical protein [Terracidiphilus sp.]